MNTLALYLHQSRSSEKQMLIGKWVCRRSVRGDSWKGWSGQGMAGGRQGKPRDHSTGLMPVEERGSGQVGRKNLQPWHGLEKVLAGLVVGNLGATTAPPRSLALGRDDLFCSLTVFTDSLRMRPEQCIFAWMMLRKPRGSSWWLSTDGLLVEGSPWKGHLQGSLPYLLYVLTLAAQ